MKRSQEYVWLVAIALLVASACEPSPVAGIGSGGSGGSVSLCAPDGCMTCELNAGFYADQCPVALNWCANLLTGPDGRCPAGLNPLFCVELDRVPSDACVQTTVSVCDPGVAAAFCCSPAYAALGPEFYCNDISDCVAGTDCLLPACWPYGPTDGWTNPYGTTGHCVYEAVSDGTPCSQPGGDHCENGACVAFAP